ncbi:MAG: 4Fe-4S binding protein [Deltaproteobacteria bacterium]|nr:4Fe-4S binding protein [Deltaproteobacteria bacterium]
MPQAGEDCILCETCLDRCFFGALSIDEDAGRVVCDPEKCIGCGICTITCPQETLKLHRFERSIPFSTSMELWKTIYTENKSS